MRPGSSPAHAIEPRRSKHSPAPAFTARAGAIYMDGFFATPQILRQGPPLTRLVWSTGGGACIGVNDRLAPL